MTRINVLLLLSASFAAAVGQLFFKLGASGKTHVLGFLNWQILSGVVFYLTGAAVWVYVLSMEKLTDTYAFTALTFVIVYVGGVFILGEKLSPWTVMGVLLVLLGLYLIVAGPEAS